MTSQTLKEKLNEQINSLPDEVVQQIADYTLFIMARRNIKPLYAEWTQSEWQDFSLSQFFRDEDDEVSYSIKDAKEIYET
ncbi:MAG: hypothetical protein Kow002_02980 [Anaerolineales bacterium]